VFAPHCIRPFGEAFYASMLSTEGFMKSSHVLLIVPLICSICHAAPTTLPSRSYVGDEMSIEITEQNDNITGSIKMSGSTFPLVAKMTDDRILGTFRGLDGEDVAFTGTLTTSAFTMDVNNHHYELVRKEAAVLGVIGGIGAALDISNDSRSLRIAKVLPDSPAEKAELQEGDLITQIGDQRVATLNTKDAIEMIRGPVGTKVKLRIESAGNTKNITLTRERLPLPASEPAEKE
jgi:hypothetical protein